MKSPIMDANSKKFMEKSVEKSVAKEESTIEESLGGTKEAPESVAVTIEESLGGTKEAPEIGAAIKEGTSEGTKEASKSVAFAVEKPLAGNKNKPEKSPEKPLENTKPGNKAEKTKPNVDVKPIAGTNKNEDANLEKLFTGFGKEMHPTNWKRTRHYFGKHFGQENEDPSNKKLKTHGREETVDSVAFKYLKRLEMSKSVADPEFIEKVRGAIGTFTRRDLDDLLIQKMIEEKKAKSTSGNKPLEEAKAKSRAGTSAKPKIINWPIGFSFPKNVDENPSVNKEEHATTSEKNAAREGLATAFKGIRDFFVEKSEVEDKPPNKMYNIDKVVYLNEMIVEESRKMVKTMTRRQLEDLVIEKIIQENRANSEIQLIRSQLNQRGHTLDTYQFKIAEVNQKVNELNMLATNTTKFNFLSRLNLTRQSHAPGDEYPPTYEPYPTEPFFGTKPDQNASKCSTKVRPAPPVYSVRRTLKTYGGKQAFKDTIPGVVKDFNNAVSKAKDTSITVSANMGQSPNNAVKNTAQPEGKQHSF